MARTMLGGRYRDTNTSTQGSFVYRGHQNVAITTTATDSAPITQELVLISATDYYRLAVNATADTSSMILPPGITPLVLPQGATTLSFLRIGAADSEASIILPEV